MKIVKIYSELIKESQGAVIEKLVGFLNGSYEPKMGITRDETLGEYNTEPAIMNKIDGKVMARPQLLDYIHAKFHEVSKEFIDQVLTDWAAGKYKNGDFHLSKNIPM